MKERRTITAVEIKLIKDATSQTRKISTAADKKTAHPGLLAQVSSALAEAAEPSRLRSSCANHTQPQGRQPGSGTAPDRAHRPGNGGTRPGSSRGGGASRRVTPRPARRAPLPQRRPLLCPGTEVKASPSGRPGEGRGAGRRRRRQGGLGGNSASPPTAQPAAPSRPRGETRSRKQPWRPLTPAWHGRAHGEAMEVRRHRGGSRAAGMRVAEPGLSGPREGAGWQLGGAVAGSAHRPRSLPCRRALAGAGAAASRQPAPRQGRALAVRRRAPSQRSEPVLLSVRGGRWAERRGEGGRWSWRSRSGTRGRSRWQRGKGSSRTKAFLSCQLWT